MVSGLLGRTENAHFPFPNLPIRVSCPWGPCTGTVIFRSGCGMHLRQKECRQGRSLGSQSRFWRLCLHTAHVSSRFIGAAGVEEEDAAAAAAAAAGGGDISLMRVGDGPAAVLSAEEDDDGGGRGGGGGGGSVLSAFGVPSVTLATPSLDVVSASGTFS